MVESEGFRSLAAERVVFSVVGARGWSCVHGPTYADPETRKIREIDVLASRCWAKGKDDRRRVRTIFVPIEVKTADEWHVVFPPERDGIAVSAFGVWVGTHEHKKVALQSLRSTGLTSHQLSTVSKEWSKVAYDRDGYGGSGLPESPAPATFVAMTFQETKPEAERERDASVLWKAIRAVNAATEALIDDITDQRHERITDDADVMIDVGEDPVPDTLKGVHVATRHHSLIHPVVVTGSSLWATHGRQIKKVDSFRFVECSVGGGIRWWCDVVNSSGVDGYFTALSEHYADGMRKARSPSQ